MIVCNTHNSYENKKCRKGLHLHRKAKKKKKSSNLKGSFFKVYAKGRIQLLLGIQNIWGAKL